MGRKKDKAEKKDANNRKSKLRKKHDVVFESQVCILTACIAFWGLYILLWCLTVSQLEDYNPAVNTPDGIKASEVSQGSGNIDWEGGQSEDYTKLPEIQKGFGDVNTPTEIGYVGMQDLKSRTNLYVLTKQSPAELGIEKEEVTLDGKDGFSIDTDIDGQRVHVGKVDITDMIASWRDTYPDDYARLKDCVEDKSNVWYEVVYNSEKEDVIKQDKVDFILRGVFGKKLDPERTTILYCGGATYIKGTS